MLWRPPSCRFCTGAKYTARPGTAATSRRRDSITLGMASRSPRGLSSMNMRPVLMAGDDPPPMATTMLLTAGLARMRSAASRRRSDIASKEMSCGPSALTRIWPMSSSGKKPLGIVTNSTAVSTKVRPAATSTVRRCARHQSSPRA
ncbi:hypothetical protein D9M70_513590 [compost metagenome]